MPMETMKYKVVFMKDVHATIKKIILDQLYIWKTLTLKS